MEMRRVYSMESRVVKMGENLELRPAILSFRKAEY